MTPTPLKAALKAAPDRATAIKTRPEQEFFCFRIGDHRMGVPSENVREVSRMGPLTPLPRMPGFVLGVCGHRGEVLPVIDVLRFLGKGETRIGPRTRLFVGISPPFHAAVVADSVLGLIKVGVGDILPAPMGGDSSNEHVLGVVHPEDKERALTLIAFAKLLTSARQRVVAR